MYHRLGGRRGIYSVSRIGRGGTYMYSVSQIGRVGGGGDLHVQCVTDWESGGGGDLHEVVPLAS